MLLYIILYYIISYCIASPCLASYYIILCIIAFVFYWKLMYTSLITLMHKHTHTHICSTLQ